MTDTTHTAVAPVETVVVVNGTTEAVGKLETVLDGDRYDLVFVESSGRAYSQIKKIAPTLVVLYASIDEPDSVQLLTMLKLDAQTKDIPVLTYSTECEGTDVDAAVAPPADDDDFTPARPPLCMN